MKSLLLRSATKAACLNCHRNLASISFNKFGPVNSVCKVSDGNESENSTRGVKIAIKACEVTIDDIRNVRIIYTDQKLEADYFLF